MADSATILTALDTALASALTIGAVLPPPVGSGVLATLQPGFARNLGPYIDAASSWEASKQYKRTDYSGLVYIGGGRVALFGGGHGGAQMSDLRILDVMTGQWSSPSPSIEWLATTEANLDRSLGKWIPVNQPTARHTYNMQVFVPSLNRLYLMTADGMVDNTVASVAALAGWSGRISWYDFGTQQWSFSQRAGTPWIAASSAAIDPVGGKILVIGPTAPNSGTADGFWLYDPATDAAPQFVSKRGFPVNGGAQDLVYCPDNDRFYSMIKGTAAVYEIALNRTTPAQTTATLLATTGTKPPNVGNAPTGYAYDTINKIIGGHVVNGKFYAFDPLTRIWTAKVMQYEVAQAIMPTQVFHCCEFDPVSGCFVFLENQPSNGRKATWAYRYG